MQVVRTSSVRDGPPTVASLLALAESSKDVYEEVAATLDRLADRGGPYAARRRALAERSRRFAELEQQHIRHWTARQTAQPRS